MPLLTGHDCIVLPIGANPPGFNYTALVYSLTPYPSSIQGSGVTDVQAVAGVVSEPTTMFLVERASPVLRAFAGAGPVQMAGIRNPGGTMISAPRRTPQ